MAVDRSIACITALLCLLSAGGLARETVPASAAEPPKVVGYLPSWSASVPGAVAGLAGKGLTHVLYGMAMVQADGHVVPPAEWQARGRQGVQAALSRLKARQPGLRVVLTVGGWSESRHFSRAVATPASRAAFTASCVDLVASSHGLLDGIDIDWEYPRCCGLAPKGSDAYSDADTEHLTAFMRMLRVALDGQGRRSSRHLSLTIAAPAFPLMASHFDWAGLTPLVDWVGLMSYDFHGPWSSVTHFNAPLGRAKGDPDDPWLTVADTVARYRAAGVPDARLVVGVPFYGVHWRMKVGQAPGLFQPFREAQSWEYSRIAALPSGTWERHWEPEAASPWLSNAKTGEVVTFDDAASIRAKGAFIRQEGLGGAMIWEVGSDDAGHGLLRALVATVCGAPLPP